MSDTQDDLYKYTPSIPAAAVTIVVFVLLLALHIYRLSRTKTWFCLPLLIGSIFEITGYSARLYGHSNRTSLPPYIIQYLLILLAPILFAASVYMFLARIMRSTGCASLSLVRPTLLTKIFVVGDVVCFVVQMGGGAILAGSNSRKSSDVGNAIVLAGLGLQIVVFGFFVVVGALWHKRMWTEGARLGWERWMWMLYAASALITLRNLFRVVEYAMGEDGYLLATEWPIYVFDALLMAFVLALCSQWYISDMASKQSRESASGLMESDMELNRSTKQRHYRLVERVRGTV